MQYVHFLNIEYIFARLYEMLAGFKIYFYGTAGSFSSFSFWYAVIGFSLGFIFLALLVYAAIRMVQVEHVGFTKRAEHERARLMQTESTGKNARWEQIVALMELPDENAWRRAIIDADAMLDEQMIEQGTPGETMGDRLKNSNKLQFTTLDLAWQAHKVRNAVAHLGEAYPLSEREARATVDLYKRVFEEFEII